MRDRKRGSRSEAGVAITERQDVLGVQGGQSYQVGEAEEVKEKEALSSLKAGLGEAGSWGSGREHRVSKGTEAG